MALLFRVALVLIFSLLFLVLVVVKFNSDEIVNNDGERKTSVLFLP